MPPANQSPDKRWRAKGGLTCLVDVTGFTPLTEELTRLGPEGNEYLSGLLNAFFGALTDEVAQAGGHILQFCGDALWAYFSNADAGERACRRMLRRIQELGEHTVGGRKYKLEASLAAARGLEERRMIRFWVRDNGLGLTPDEQARLFTPFTRLDQVRAKGHGLGLSIVRRIVEKLGGQVGVESTVGQGSIFSFTLPEAEPLERQSA